MPFVIRSIVVMTILAISPTTSLLAESLDTQSNPVDSGAITVASEDPDRSDWDDIPAYEHDDDFEEFYPIDIDRVQVAHDATHLYFHIEALEWDTEETWRIGAYLDTDQDLTTGYTGNFLPLGADYFVEGDLAFAFNAATQADWGWTENGTAVRDQTNMLDVEVAISRLDIGNPTDIDFILYANNFCCDFQMPDDIYPNEVGGVFTYELGEAVVAPAAGDCNGDGVIDASDLACVGTVEDRDIVLAELETLAGDLDGDGTVAFPDFLILSANFGSDLTSYTAGNIDLAGGIAFPDFLVLSANFGQTAGASPVPEPAALPLCIVAAFALMGLTRKRIR